MNTTLRKEISDALKIRNETWNDIVSIAIGKPETFGFSDQNSESELTIDADSGEVSYDLDTELDREYNCGYGSAESAPVTVWTKNYVYFPVTYDGSEWISSVSRNPNGIATSHVGGE